MTNKMVRNWNNNKYFKIHIKIGNRNRNREHSRDVFGTELLLKIAENSSFSFEGMF